MNELIEKNKANPSNNPNPALRNQLTDDKAGSANALTSQYSSNTPTTTAPLNQNDEASKKISEQNERAENTERATADNTKSDTVKTDSEAVTKEECNPSKSEVSDKEKNLETNKDKTATNADDAEKDEENEEAESDELDEQSDKTTADAESSENAAPLTIKINLSFIDPLGKGIAELSYRIVLAHKTIEGVTDSKGNAGEIDGVNPMIPMEILIKRDDQSWASKYKGETACADMNICAQSPLIKLTVTPEEHQGEKKKALPTQAGAAKPAIPKPPLPLATQITGIKPPSEIKPIADRNEQGHPLTSYKAASDWAERNLVPFWAKKLYDEYKNWRKENDQKEGINKASGNAPANPTQTTGKITSPPHANTNGNSNASNKISEAKKPIAQASGPVIKVNSLDQAPPQAVTELVAVMEQQSTWQWEEIYKKQKLNTGAIISKLANKVWEPPTGKSAGKPDSRCYPSVKIGLMRANLVREVWGDIPAKGAGKWLQSQGFTDVTTQVPDARWAAPGDIIVYRYDDNTEAKNIEKYKDAFKKYEEEKQAYPNKLKQWEQQHQARQEQQSVLDKAALDQKNSKQKKARTVLPKEEPRPKEPTEPDAENWGHIDVRTYDGYISDFKTRMLPRAIRLNEKQGFVVTGIFRKVYDPLPEIRVKAFLKILREWECHAIADDTKRYFALYREKGMKEQPYFADISKHPYEDADRDRPAGGYQIRLTTYKGLTNPIYGVGTGFSPSQQDRLAIALIENYSNSNLSCAQGDALKYIRTGEIDKAIKILSVNQWASLSGNSQSTKINEATGKIYTVDEVVFRHTEIMKEMLKK